MSMDTGGALTDNEAVWTHIRTRRCAQRDVGSTTRTTLLASVLVAALSAGNAARMKR
jgi:hypothetical protein